VPKFAVVDDSWRQSLLSSADSSLVSDADDSLHQLSSSCIPLDTPATSFTLSATVNSTTADSVSFTALHGRDADEKYRGKHKVRAKRVINVSDNPEVSPPVSFLHKRRRFKCCQSQTLSSVGDDTVECGAFPTCKQLKQNLSETLPSDYNHSHSEIHTQRRRSRLKRSLTHILPSDSDDHVEHDETVVRKRRRLSASKTSLPRTQNKTAEDATATITLPRAKVVKAGSDVADGIQIACTSVGNARLTNVALVAGSGEYLQNLSAGKCYVLQPVVKVKVFSFSTYTYTAV